jgi:AbrB family looped-hinge helix DNA binding protein
MALVKLRRSGQITLSAALRKRFGLSEGDYLEAEEVKDGILLKPVSVVEREAARRHLLAVMDRVHAKQPQRTRDAREDEEDIAREIKAYRAEHA